MTEQNEPTMPRAVTHPFLRNPMICYVVICSAQPFTRTLDTLEEARAYEKKRGATWLRTYQVNTLNYREPSSERVPMFVTNTDVLRARFDGGDCKLCSRMVDAGEKIVSIVWDEGTMPLSKNGWCHYDCVSGSKHHRLSK